MATLNLLDPILSPIAIVALALVIWGTRHWLTKRIEGTVTHKFNKKIEFLKSNLRFEEGRVEALQRHFLEGESERQSQLIRRRFQAVEDIWNAATLYSKFEMAVNSVSFLDLDELDKRLSGSDPNLEKLLDHLGGPDMVEVFEKDGYDSTTTSKYRLYLPDHAWDLFCAYQSLIFVCHLEMKARSMGISQMGSIANHDKLLNDIKKVLPHSSEYLDKYGLRGAAQISKPIKEALFHSLKAVLLSNKEDVESIKQSAKSIEILDQTRSLTE